LFGGTVTAILIAPIVRPTATRSRSTESLRTRTAPILEPARTALIIPRTSRPARSRTTTISAGTPATATTTGKGSRAAAIVTTWTLGFALIVGILIRRRAFF